jgi:hypothetical protein
MKDLQTVRIFRYLSFSVYLSSRCIFFPLRLTGTSSGTLRQQASLTVSAPLKLNVSLHVQVRRKFRAASIRLPKCTFPNCVL